MEIVRKLAIGKSQVDKLVGVALRFAMFDLVLDVEAIELTVNDARHLEIEQLQSNLLDQLLQETLPLRMVLVLVQYAVEAAMRYILDVSFFVILVLDLE